MPVTGTHRLHRHEYVKSTIKEEVERPRRPCEVLVSIGMVLKEQNIYNEGYFRNMANYLP